MIFFSIFKIHIFSKDVILLKKLLNFDAGCSIVQVSKNLTNEREFLRCQSKMTNKSSCDFPMIKRRRVTKYSMATTNTTMLILARKLQKVMFDIIKRAFKQ